MFPKFKLFMSRRSSKGGEEDLQNSRNARVYYPPRSQENMSDLPKTWTSMRTLDERAGRLEAHGALYCCRCYKETTLVHIKGPHPFENLRCQNCCHICCQKCYTTDILAKSDLCDGQPVSNSQFRDDEIPYLTVCPDCGLSHRTRNFFKRRAADFVSLRFTDIRCSCGSVSSPKWLQLAIGTPDDWRADRNECYMKALMHRVENSVSSGPRQRQTQTRIAVDVGYLV
jgi:hypothetical protein